MKCAVCKQDANSRERVSVELFKYRPGRRFMHRECLGPYLVRKAREEREALDNCIKGLPLTMLEASLVLGVSRNHLFEALRRVGVLESLRKRWNLPVAEYAHFFEVEKRIFVRDGVPERYEVIMMLPGFIPDVVVLLSSS